MDNREPAVKAMSAILDELHFKFSQNLRESISHENDIMKRIDIKAKGFSKIGEILLEYKQISPTQKEITCIYDELFVDSVCSVYFAACSLDRPAEMLLRKVLEVGIAAVYLWDSPSIFCGWKEHDEDLNFSDMLTFISSNRYKTFITKENPDFDNKEIINVNKAKQIYRSLSNTVHGKVSTFESLVADRFNYTPNDWAIHLKTVEEVEDMLLNLYFQRFQGLFDKLCKILPPINITRIGNE